IKRFTETIDEVYFLLQIMLEAKELQQEQANLVEDVWPVLGRNVAALVDLSRDQGRKDALTQAFQLAEISKAIWLRQALSDPFYALEDRLPSEVKDARDQNQERLKGTYQRMMRLEVGNDPRQDSLRQALASQEVQLLQEADSITALINDMFADYPASNAAAHLFSPKDIQQKLLKPESLLLEFVWGEENITVLGLTRDSISGYVIPLDSSLREELQNYRSLVKDSLGLFGGRSRDKQLDSVMVAYCKTGYALYQQLLAPALTHFPRANHLIIIPDGLLSYLPFDALLTQKVHPKEARYRSLPYLIRKYTIQYEYAAGLLKRSNQKLPGKGLLAMAPAFRPDKSEKQVAVRVKDSARFHRSFRELGMTVSPLTYNIPEVEGIHGQIKGSMFTRDAASKTRFLQVAPQYRILHLATHAFASETDPDYSHLLFASHDSSSYEQLYAYELYGLNLGADLAVLSACQTGFGRLQRGEGIMSLSRAFKYAGCPNIVTSLWQAEDYSTQLLMKLFYGHLKSGMGKAEALRQAKLDFLDQAPAGTQHPFFWGNFVLIGDNGPVPLPGSTWKWILLGGLLILGGIGVWKWKKS
ncbi:MAG: CHAT domain-containing protein, partial [Bacteroidota bacterium]